ncbi:hypothetical protein K502DRAFT_324643 [Neoconidiobolus thromboides FSU 785]|nr:hypothetical protein K502DRAFT_324643 [Neoconidiobolus thromboides FSU 785]
MKLDNFYLSIIFTLITFVTCKRQKSFTKEKDNNNNLIKVAIIGAGAGGSSLSYYLGKLAIDELHRLPFEIDLFEKSPRVGGRIKSLTLEKENKFELGGGVFVNVNYNIMNATQDFDIAYSDTARGEGDFGLYNGQQFVSKLDSSYYNKAQFYYRYGWGFYQASKFANTIKAKFLKLYQSDFPTFNTVEELFQRLEILEYAKKTTREVLINEWRAGEMFTDEMLQAISRNIYTIDNELHALAGAIALIGGKFN